MNKAQVGFVGLLLTLQTSYAQVPTLRLLDRKPSALSGTAFADTISMLPLREREERIYHEISEGNVPDYLRRFVPVDLSEKIGDKVISLRVFVAPDYLAVGSNEDYFLVPMTPYTAQRIADRMNCLLPTPKLVDAIFQSAPLKLVPSPIPPTSAMTTVPVFGEHNKEVLVQRRSVQDHYPLGTLVAGDKKDIVVCKALADNPGRVAIYGWHRPDGKPIQPLFFGHFAYWADYSHGVRMIDSMGEIDGKRVSVAHILADPVLSRLLSPEGPVTRPKYTFKSFPHPDDPTIHLPIGERLDTFSPVPGVRVVVDEPTTLMRKVRLVVYALPNGNTIEQTFGRRLRPDDDWHYDIQHIGAQTLAEWQSR